MIGQTVSHYKILEKLGEGGMGVVYKAEDTKLRRSVALKFLPPGMTRDENARRRFIHEAQAASSLDHPNIAVVHEIDETEDGQSFICMAYYQGESLKQKIERGPLDIAQAIEYAVQVADGLQRAQDAGIIHRDIKPANIMITSQGAVKIVDFGIAKLSGQTHSTATGLQAGTAAYMSPEQVLGHAVDHRTDLFSLGVVLYEMVTGKRPFEGDHERALFYAIVNATPLPPSRLRAGVPRDLEGIIRNLLQKDPAQRYQSAAAVRNDLNLLRLGIPVPTPSRIRRMAGAMKSHKVIVAVVIVALAAAIVIVSSIRPRPQFTLADSDFVLVADVGNHTSDKIFDHSLTEAMKVALRQSPHVTLLSSERIANALERMQLSKNSRLDESTAVSLARREGARVVIAGGIDPLGTGYSLSWKIVDVLTGEVLSVIHREVPRIENILGEMDRISEEIRNRLGESLRDISKDAMPLDKVTTPSLEALELYSRGDKLQGQAEFQSAADLMEQAVALDSNFTIAVSDLSYIHRKIGHDSLAVYYHNRIPALVSHVSNLERFYILSTYYGPSFESDFQNAFQNAQHLVLQYPNNAEGFEMLEHLAMYTGDLNTVHEAADRSLALDSTFAATIFDNAGYAEALAGNADKALVLFRRSKQGRPAYGAVDGFMAHTYWVKGELDSAEIVLRAMIPSNSDPRTAHTRAQLVSLLYFQGELDRAGRECDTAVQLCRSGRRPATEAFFHYTLGEIALEKGNRSTWRKELALAEGCSALPFIDLVLVAASYARHGEQREAQRVISRISSVQSIDPVFVRRRDGFLQYLRGELELAAGTPEKAIEEFRRVEKLHSGDPIYFRAQEGIARCEAQSSVPAAVTTYNALLGHRGELIMGTMLMIKGNGSWGSYLLSQMHFDLGRLYLRRKDLQDADRHLRILMNYWKNADPRKRDELKKMLDQITRPR